MPRTKRDAYKHAVFFEGEVKKMLGNFLKENNERPPADPLLDPRSAAVARTHFEEGFRALYLGLGATFEQPPAHPDDQPAYDYLADTDEG